MRSGWPAGGSHGDRFDRVGGALRQGNVSLLLFALDGAEGPARRLDGGLTLGRDLPAAMALYAHELGAAFGATGPCMYR